jgi:predicted ribosomally synthesized peptide with SipW-like signal peptide
MKKRKVITAVLLVAFLLMGASYAAWSDTLVLDHNVQMGTLDVDWQPNYSGYEDPYVTLNHELGPVDPSCTMVVDYTVDDILSISINNMYPGIYAAFDIHQQNMGTLPAKFGSVTVDLSGSDPGALANVLYQFSMWKFDDSSDMWIPLGNYNGLVTGVEGFFNTSLAGVVLDAGDYITAQPGDIVDLWSGSLWLPLTAGDDAQGQFLNFDITFTWLQP